MVDNVGSDATTEPVEDAPELVSNENGEAQSSGATGEEKATLLSVARDVVAKGKAGDAGSPTAGAEVEKEHEADPAEQSDKPRDPNDYSDVPFHKHPRFKQVVQEKNELKEQVAQLTPMAQSFGQIQGFLSQNGLASDEAADALQIAGLMKINPVEAWRQLQPVLQRLAYAAGEILPPELQARVKNGELTADQALEISRAHAARNATAVSTTFNSNYAAQQRDLQVSKERVSAVDEWEADIRTRDPDYDSRKKVLVDKWVRAEIATKGLPRTPSEALSLVKRVYGEVNDHLRSLAPPKRPVRVVTGAPVAGSPTAKPKSLREAAELAIRR